MNKISYIKYLSIRFFSSFTNIIKGANSLYNTKIEKPTKLYSPYKIRESEIGAYTYIAFNSQIRNVKIGKFCSIGPNFFAGWGIHPTNGISTSPCFYSTKKQCGYTFSDTDKIEERKTITIGNDVFIGANVIILDDVSIGNGAIIGAGTIVSKDVPDYAIVAGSPMRIIRYRFEPQIIEKLQQIQWWDFAENKLSLVNKYFFDMDAFIANCENDSYNK